MTRVVVVGASGFIGSHSVQALAGRPGVSVTAASRNPTATGPDGSSGPGSSIAADLLDPASLADAFVGADVVVHAASYVGKDAALSEATNIDGTANLVSAARAAGVSRIVYVSTTSVYGTGPHRGIRVGDVPPRPESVASTHRHTAEGLVRDAGGSVLRPNLVYGAGDRWFVPALAKLTAGLGATIDAGRARISVISADDLGRLVAAVALHPDVAPGSVLHAAAPEPVTVAQVHEALAASLGFPVPTRSVTVDQARAALVPAAASEHQLALVTLDHWYDAEPAWRLAGTPPTSAFSLTDTHVDWYRRVLS